MRDSFHDRISFYRPFCNEEISCADHFRGWLNSLFSAMLSVAMRRILPAIISVLALTSVFCHSEEFSFDRDIRPTNASIVTDQTRSSAVPICGWIRSKALPAIWAATRRLFPAIWKYPAAGDVVMKNGVPYAPGRQSGVMKKYINP